jgi:hypothetical protein
MNVFHTIWGMLVKSNEPIKFSVTNEIRLLPNVFKSFQKLSHTDVENWRIKGHDPRISKYGLVLKINKVDTKYCPRFVLSMSIFHFVIQITNLQNHGVFLTLFTVTSK